MPKGIRNLKINLETKILNSDVVFIISHNHIDLDAFASTIGIALISSKLKKDTYIVIDDEYATMDSLVKRLMNEKCINFNFINRNRCLELLSGNNLLVVTDVNNKDRIALGDDLDKFSDSIVIDHHQLGNNLITCENTYSFTNSSSSSEIVTNLLKAFCIKYDKNIATSLLAGIYLDTGNRTKNCSANTLRTMATLIDRGGDDNYIASLFMGDYSESMIKYEIASRSNTEFRTFTNETDLVIADEKIRDTSFERTISLAISVDEKTRGKISLAQAADYLLNFADVSITLSNISDDTISVHGRSKGEINIGELFKKIDGGGSFVSSATEMHNVSLKQAKEKVLSIFPTLSNAQKF